MVGDSSITQVIVHDCADGKSQDGHSGVSVKASLEMRIACFIEFEPATTRMTTQQANSDFMI